jgi:hypothetical protein
MKKTILLTFAVLFLYSFLFNCHAAEDFPVCYWQLIDEEMYVYRHDMKQLGWREVRKQRERNRTASQTPKLLDLHCVTLENLFAKPSEPSCTPVDPPLILVRDPDGRVNRLNGFPEKNGIVTIPDDAQLNGRYLLGICLNLEDRDMDGDGRAEKVYAAAKHLVVHYKDGGNMGADPDVFFNTEEMPLEIGPAISPAQSRFGGSIQSPHNRYKMMVRFRNRPMAGAAVIVAVEGCGWKKGFTTDAAGQFEIMPFDDRSLDRFWQKLIYVATYHERDRNAFHIATLPVVVLQNRPEWRSQAAGFTYWGIIASAGVLLLIVGIFRHESKLREKSLLGFENYKIKKE